MTETLTPGAVNYLGYCIFWMGRGLSEQALLPWHTLTPEMQAAWEAAAQAVLAQEAQEALRNA